MLIFCFSSKTLLNFPSMGEHCIGDFSIGMVLSLPHSQVLHPVAQPCTDDSGNGDPSADYSRIWEQIKYKSRM